MELNYYMDKLTAGRATRRDFVKAAWAAGLAVALTPALPLRSRAAQEINYFTWAGYDAPGLHQSYVDKYGGSPNISFFGNEEEALTKMRAGYKPDLVHPCVEVAKRWRGADLIKPMDPSRLENWKDVFPELHTMDGFYMDGQAWICPIEFGNNSVTYRTDIVEIEGEESYWLLFDERYKGRIAVQNDFPAVAFALLALGVSEPWNSTDEEIAEAKELLMKQRELVRFYWDSPTLVDNAMAAGEVVVASSWNDVPARLSKQGIPVKYMNPKEGKIIWGCGISLVNTEIQNEQAAYDFIDAMLDPRTGKYWIEEFGFGHSNMKSYDLVDPDVLEGLALKDPSDLFNNGIWYQEPSAEIHLKQTRMWEEVRAGG